MVGALERLEEGASAEIRTADPQEDDAVGLIAQAVGEVDALAEFAGVALTPQAVEQVLRRRLAEVKVELDRCWDLLRQRRALEEFGMDPDAAAARDESVVEGYEQ